MPSTKHPRIDARRASFDYDAFADVLTITLDDRSVASVEDDPAGVLLHRATDGTLVAVEILGFSVNRAVDMSAGMVRIGTSDPVEILIPRRVMRMHD